MAIRIETTMGTTGDPALSETSKKNGDVPL